MFTSWCHGSIWPPRSQFFLVHILSKLQLRFQKSSILNIDSLNPLIDRTYLAFDLGEVHKFSVFNQEFPLVVNFVKGFSILLVPKIIIRLGIFYCSVLDLSFVCLKLLAFALNLYLRSSQHIIMYLFKFIRQHFYLKFVRLLVMWSLWRSLLRFPRQISCRHLQFWQIIALKVFQITSCTQKAWISHFAWFL